MTPRPNKGRTRHNDSRTGFERCYGVPAELDFIINYDIKYRLGRDTEGEEE